MNAETLKEKISSGEISDSELLKAFEHTSGTRSKGKSSFLKTVIQGYIDGYTTPQLWRVMLESILISMVVTGVVILAYANKVDATVAAVMLAFVLGFLFGKIKG